MGLNAKAVKDTENQNHRAKAPVKKEWMTSTTILNVELFLHLELRRFIEKSML